MKTSILKSILAFSILLVAAVAFQNQLTPEHYLAAGMSLSFFAFPAIRGGQNKYQPTRDEARRVLSNYSGANNTNNARNGRQANPMNNAGGAAPNPWFSFGGPNSSFWDVVQNPACKYFYINFVNSDPTTDYDIYLGPDIHYTPGTAQDNLITDGVIQNTGGSVTATAASGYSSIDDFVQYQYQNPTLFLGMKISSNNSLQIAVNCTYQPKEPYVGQLTSTPIPLINMTDEDDFKSAFITCDLRPYNVELGNQSRFTLPIVANSASSILFYMGPTLNSTHYLRSQAQTGMTSAMRSGARMSKLSGKRR